MTALPVENIDLACRRCGMTTDQCLSLREDCCSGCTHYPEPADDYVDEVAVARAVSGDLAVPLNRAEHAAAHAHLHAQGLSAGQIAARLGTTARSVDRWNNGHTSPISRRGATMNDDTATLLAKASAHPAKAIRNAGQRAVDAIERVRELLTADEGKSAARERVAQLEKELREAKAALRGKPVVVTAQRRAQTAPVDGGIPCPNGCGKVSVNAAGASAHARFCHHLAASA